MPIQTTKQARRTTFAIKKALKKAGFENVHVRTWVSERYTGKTLGRLHMRELDRGWVARFDPFPGIDWSGQWPESQDTYECYALEAIKHLRLKIYTVGNMSHLIPGTLEFDSKDDLHIGFYNPNR